ncbi:hypothetical protein ACSQ67_014865 [Phaseolus vulgaris]
MFPLFSLKSSVKHNRKHEAPDKDTSAAVMALLTESQLPLFLKIGEKMESKDCASWDDHYRYKCSSHDLADRVTVANICEEWREKLESNGCFVLQVIGLVSSLLWETQLSSKVAESRKSRTVLNKDAVLLASQGISEWPELNRLPSYGRGTERYTSFIFGKNLTDVIVTGMQTKSCMHQTIINPVAKVGETFQQTCATHQNFEF